MGRQCWRTAVADPAAAVALATAGLAEAARLGDPRLGSDLHLCRGYAEESQSRIESAAAEYELGVREGRRLQDQDLLAKALVLRGELRYYRGQFGDALADLKQAYDLDVALKHEREARYALNAIANLYADSRVGQYDRAIEYYRQILAAHEAAGRLTEISTAYYNLGSTMERKGDLAGALEHYRRSLAIERRRKDEGEIAYSERSVGIVLTKQGKPREALRLFDHAVATFTRLGDAERLAQVQLSRGIARRALGRLPAALADLEAARRRFVASPNDRFLEKIEDERAGVFAAAGDWQRAFAARTAQLSLQQKLSAAMREEHTSRLRVQFDTEKKEQENRALLRENALRGRALADAERIRSLQRVVILLGALVIAGLAYLAVRYLRNARRMKILALTDELTRLPNRRHILTVAAEQLREARRRGTPFCLLALDIDHFKRINDTYGHDAGDQVLRRVAATCRAGLRHADLMGRTGGEEFLIVLPRTTAAVALEVAERLRAAVEALDWPELDPQKKVTLSLGLTERAAADADLTALAKRVDESLYRAKETGRNRVHLEPVAA